MRGGRPGAGKSARREAQRSAQSDPVEVTPPLADLCAPPFRCSDRANSSHQFATNLGVSRLAAIGTVVTDTLPAGAHDSAATATQGTCTHTTATSKPKTSTVTCTPGRLAAGPA